MPTAAPAPRRKSLANASGRTFGELSYASVDTQENIRIIAPMQRRGGAHGNGGASPRPDRGVLAPGRDRNGARERHV